MSRQIILRVAVSAPLRSLFDYLPPEGCDPSRLLPGSRLRVPFGRGERCAVLLGTDSQTILAPGKLKRVRELLDAEPLLSPEDLALLQWAANYYQHPLGDVIFGALPVRLRKTEALLRPGQPGWRLTPAGEGQDPGQLPGAPRQAAILRLLRTTSDGVAQQQIYRQCGESRAVLRRLQLKGWLEPCEIAPEPAVRTAAMPVRGPALNTAQQAAVSAVAERLDGFAAFLLDGVTGSGKTEVYLRLVELVVSRGLQALILVPEIGLTPQLLQRFRQRIPLPTAVLHSALSDREREMAWQDARQGRARLVLGTRSALFTPMPELGLVVVDEEHDLSLKQQDGFRYSARDLAVVRAQRSDCPILLGSATPSLESLRNVDEGRYRQLQLRQRAGAADSPQLDLLDIRSVRLEAGVSPTLMRILEQELQFGNQVLLFLNRRGYAPLLTCHDCGWVAECRRCDARMTLHLASSQLWCHHCGAQRPLDSACPECGGRDLRPLGQGTERLQGMLQQRFPGTGIVRIDRDTTRRKGSLEKLLEEIHEGKYSLLLGTQMLAKGHHFPNVTLVGILDVDQGLFGADYRAAERMAQLIVQVAGRAGRAEKAGRVLIQTRHPDHPLLGLLLRNGYDAFAREALAERREALLPPYSYQALLRAEAHRERDPVEFLEQAAALANGMAAPGVEFWGPVPAPMERRAGRYRAHLLVQAGQRPLLQALIARWVPQLDVCRSAGRVRWSIDVDPQEML